jgi:hypothetical protein
MLLFPSVIGVAIDGIPNLTGYCCWWVALLVTLLTLPALVTLWCEHWCVIVLLGLLASHCCIVIDIVIVVLRCDIGEGLTL